jgi:alkylation response protein AidB-like acyl-CoA dehydrogenase
MDFAFSADQDELRSAARRLLADRLPPARIHETADAPDDPAPDRQLWAELVDLGWVGLSTPDGGGTFLDEAVLLEEAGFALLGEPLLSSVVCLPALAKGADATSRTALAWAEPDGPRLFAAAGAITATATAAADGWRVDGTKCDVVDLASAEQAVVLAASADGPGLFLVRVEPGAVRIQPTTDGTRRIGVLSLEQAPAELLADAAATPDLLTVLRRRAEAAIALESVGVAQRMLETAAEHAKQREQFGRVIGTYQGVSHHVADMYVRTELARSLAYRAAWCVATSYVPSTFVQTSVFTVVPNRSGDPASYATQ